MWKLTNKEWIRNNSRNKKLNLKSSLPREIIYDFSYELNNRVNYSEKWFDHILMQKSDNLGKELILRKNYPIGNRFFADYYIKGLNIVIEIDDSSHSTSYDNFRDSVFRRLGLKVIRIKYLDKTKADDVIKTKLNKHGSNFVLITKEIKPQKKKSSKRRKSSGRIR